MNDLPIPQDRVRRRTRVQNSLSNLRLQIEYVPPDALRANSRRLRKADKRLSEHLRPSIQRFGIVLPIIIDSDGVILHGHEIAAAAQEIGLSEVPTIRIEHLTSEEVRALRIALHKLSELSSWDEVVLKSELEFLIDFDFELASFTGFSSAEFDVILNDTSVGEDDLPAPSSVTISQVGDVWLFEGGHKLACLDALSNVSYLALMAGELAGLVICDSPYNCKIAGNVTSRSCAREFPMASGEMSSSEFTEFLRAVFALLAQHSRAGSLSYQFMDWRHIAEMLQAGHSVYSSLLNLCVWAKTNGGMGSMYRSAHELCFVWKLGDEAHVNNVQLGKHGRNRTNVWSYPGANVPQRGSSKGGEEHVTPKNVAMVQDAILDASNRGDIVLDVFAGSATTLVGAHRAKRRGFGMELDPVYVDLGVRRLERVTGAPAVHVETGLTFAQLTTERATAAFHPARERRR